VREPDQWERAGGVSCAVCGRETLRLVVLTNGMTGCPYCLRRARQKRAKAEASLGPVADTVQGGNPKLARRIRRYIRRQVMA